MAHQHDFHTPPTVEADGIASADVQDQRAGWHPDPLGRYEFRWFDGTQWTAEVAVGGQRCVDPLGVAHAPARRGLAVASLVVALVSMSIAWLPLLFAVSIAGALAWAYLFYVGQSLTPAAVCLTGCALITVICVAAAWSQAWWMGALLLPYQAWLLVAASLSWGYAALNR